MEKPSEKSEVYNLLCDLLKGRFAGKSGIIYTFSIKDAEDLAGELITRGSFNIIEKLENIHSHRTESSFLSEKHRIFQKH